MSFRYLRLTFFFWLCLNGSMSNFHNNEQKSISSYSFRNAWMNICVEAWKLCCVISASLWWWARGCHDRGVDMVPTFMWYCGIFPSKKTYNKEQCMEARKRQRIQTKRGSHYRALNRQTFLTLYFITYIRRLYCCHWQVLLLFLNAFWIMIYSLYSHIPSPIHMLILHVTITSKGEKIFHF